MKSNTHCPLGTHLAKLRFALLVLLMPLLTACTTFPNLTDDPFEAAPSKIDSRIAIASIEEYIIALPPFAYHEEGVRQFNNRVMRARAEQKQNSGKGIDSLYVGGDGSWPPKEFTLDRDQRTLSIHVFSWEPGVRAYTETMKRVPGGWIRGPRTELESQDPAVREHPDRWVLAQYSSPVQPTIP